ncbi:MAG: hypothetical protein J6Y37_01675 [Paludibacteraceae bacterium]|nr:hypothetical protein [Paludibacteraceae bacterium]
MPDNLIHSLTINLSFEKNEGNSNDRAEKLYKRHIYPSIEEVFNQYESEEIVIDNITIDLGEIEEDDIPSKLLEELKSKIQKIRSDKQENSFSKTTADGNDIILSYEQSSLPSHIIQLANEIKMAGKDSQTQYECVQLMQYLCNEEFPWQYTEYENFATSDYPHDILQEIISDDSLFDIFFHAIYGNAMIVWRLLQIEEITILIEISKKIILRELSSLPPEFHEYEKPLLHYILAEERTPKERRSNRQSDVSINKNDFTEVHSRPREHNHFIVNDIKVILSLLLGVKYDIPIGKETKTFQEEKEMQEWESIQTNKNRIKDRKEILDNGVSNDSHALNEQKNRQISDDYLGGTKKEGETPIDNNKSAHQENSNDNRVSINPNEQKERQTSDQPIENQKDNDSLIEEKQMAPNKQQESQAIMGVASTSDLLLEDLLRQSEKAFFSEQKVHGFSQNHRVHISDAGLVLIHPFLTSFFSRLGLLTEEKQFISADAQKRAVHLLKHLTGLTDKHQSPFLALEKVLCGLPLSFPIDSKFEITEEEKEEAEELLNTVCEYWKPLNKSSYQGLQDTFFKREGTIEFSDEAWIIRVEGNAFDILLEDLTWEISTIILPWLEPMIYVEWQAE